jgi:tetratricopeptide (TPR) repeat protein
MHSAVIGSALYFVRRVPLFSLGIFWFYVMLAPVSNIVSLSCPEADRYLYMPAAGLFISVAALAGMFYERHRGLGLVFFPAGVVLLVFWAIATGFRVQDWRDNYTLWSHEYELNPGNHKALAEMAVCENHAGNHEKAGELAALALKISQDNGVAWLELGKSLHMAKQYSEALVAYQRAIGANVLHPYQVGHAWLCAGMILDDNQQKYDEAAQAYRNSLECDPFSLDAAIRLGVICGNRGDTQSALTVWRKAQEHYPDNPVLRKNIELAEKR